MSITKKSILLILGILIIDQIIKVVVKTNMSIGEEIHVIGNWFILHFTENNGMAFGMDLPGDNSKIILSIFRIIAVTGIAFYLRFLIRQAVPNGLVLAVSMIFAGAMGNIIDSAFYGMIFSDSWGRVAEIFPETGYSSFLHGRVVDIFYFPIIRASWPSWFPWLGGSSFVFFRPVFNIADSAITVGVSFILIFQRSFFKEEPKKPSGEEISGESAASNL